jgi:RHS repeat-associated protein
MDRRRVCRTLFLTLALMAVAAPAVAAPSSTTSTPATLPQRANTSTPATTQPGSASTPPRTSADLLPPTSSTRPGATPSTTEPKGPQQPGTGAERATPPGTITITAGPPGSAAGPRAVAAQAAPSIPFTQCPPVGLNTGCAILVEITDAATNVFEDPNQGPYDGVEDTLIGVVNTSGRTVTNLSLSSDTDLFGFDGDGLCDVAPHPSGCPFGPTGYEGPTTTFANITPDRSGGTILFTGGLAPAASTYFSLEESLRAVAVFAGGPTVPEQGGAPNPSQHQTTCSSSWPVNCATGEFWHTFDDLSVAGRGVALSFRRTYTASATPADGPLGFGWASNYTMALLTAADGTATVIQENGSAVSFRPNGSGGYLAAPRVLATLTREVDGTYSFLRRADRVRFIFDTVGRLVRLVDRNGYATTLQYTGAQLTSVTDPAGRAMTFTYSGNRIAGVTDPAGRSESFTYNGGGDMTAAANGMGERWGFAYNGAHQMERITDPRGGVTTNTFDANGRVIAQVDPAGLRTTWAYAGDPASSAGGTTTMTDPHGVLVTYEYADLELNRLTRAAGAKNAAATSYTYDPATLGITTITDPDGHVTSTTYNGMGDILTSTDPLGATTRFEYNALDEVTRKISPLGETATFDYDASGNLLNVVSPAGGRTMYRYDDRAHPGDLTAVTDPDGRVVSQSLDAAGNVVARSVSPSAGVLDAEASSYNADGQPICQAEPTAVALHRSCPGSTGVTLYTYDDAGRLSTVTDPEGHVTRYAYDGSGNRTAVTDPNGNVVSTSYDPDNRPLTVTTGANGPSAAITSAAYDIPGGRGACTATAATFCETITDPNGHVTVDYYNALSQKVLETRAGAKVASFTWDGAGNQLSRTDADGGAATFSYDAANRVTGVAYSDGVTPNVSFTYNADSQRTSMVDGTGTTTYSYDADARPTATTDGNGSTVRYAYDPAGAVTGLTYPDGKVVTRSYDGAGRIAKVHDWLGGDTTFRYDGDGNLLTTALPNGDTVASTFDTNDQMKTTVAAPSAAPSSALISLTYERDPAMRVTKEVAAGASSATTQYSYDQLDRLTAAGSTTYKYDKDGNPSQLGPVAQTFNGLDELTASSRASTSTSFSYDAEGDRTQMAVGRAAPTTYAFDNGRRLTSISAPVGLPPAIVALQPAGGARDGGTVVTIVGSHFTGATSVRFGTSPAEFSVLSDNAITATAPAGAGVVDVAVTGPGGSSAPVPGDQFSYLAGPAVTKVSPAVGPASGGSLVTISGSRLDGTSRVSFGSRPALVLAVRPTFVIARSPAGIGTVDVTVTTKNGTSAAAAADRFTYLSGPGLSGVAPSFGPPAGGTGVILTGFNLNGATAVRFGAASAKFKVLSSSVITATSPPGSGVVDVTVVTPQGASPATTDARFAYGDRPPVVAAPPPAAAPDTGPPSQPPPVPSSAPATAATTTKVSYTYNGDGLRATKQAAAGVRHFTWSITGAYPQLLVDNDLRFIYGPDRTPLAQVDGSGAIVYFVHDVSGTTRALLGAGGAVSASFTYDAFGALTASSGPARTPIHYTGGYLDDESSFTYLIQRYYDPATAQFITVDPLLDLTLAPYSYAADDPTNRIDPLGLKWYNPFSWTGKTWAGVATGVALVGIGIATAGVGDVVIGGVAVTEVTATEATGVLLTEESLTVATTTLTVAETTEYAITVGDAVTYAGWAASAGGAARGTVDTYRACRDQGFGLACVGNGLLTVGTAVDPFLSLGRVAEYYYNYAILVGSYLIPEGRRC